MVMIERRWQISNHSIILHNMVQRSLSQLTYISRRQKWRISSIRISQIAQKHLHTEITSNHSTDGTMHTVKNGTHSLLNLDRTTIANIKDPILVRFRAPSCPCGRRMRPTWETAARKSPRISRMLIKIIDQRTELGVCVCACMCDMVGWSWPYCLAYFATSKGDIPLNHRDAEDGQRNHSGMGARWIMAWPIVQIPFDHRIIITAIRQVCSWWCLCLCELHQFPQSTIGMIILISISYNYYDIMARPLLHYLLVWFRYKNVRSDNYDGTISRGDTLWFRPCSI